MLTEPDADLREIAKRFSKLCDKVDNEDLRETVVRKIGALTPDTRKIIDAKLCWVAGVRMSDKAIPLILEIRIAVGKLIQT